MHLLNSFPRYPLLHGETKIEPLDRLSDFLKGPRIFVKRDDQNELGGGGNKLRKLEFLLGDAQAKNAGTIITSGARQSNHARLTAAASVRAGLKCELALARRVAREDEDYLWSGNILLNKILGVTLHDLPADANVQKFIEARTNELMKQGRRVYVVPMGGSNALGALGYVRCAFEINEQSMRSNIQFDKIIVPNGSAGTHAGLVVGFRLLNKNAGSVMAYSVLNTAETANQQTIKLAHETGRLLKSDFVLEPNDVVINDSQLGIGYGIPTTAMIEAVKLLARTEGLLIDPVYSGKAFAGLIESIRQGQYQKHENILFIMTGGLPGLYAYRSIF
jgi:L-cysteate sulfo-lyase